MCVHLTSNWWIKCPLKPVCSYQIVYIFKDISCHALLQQIPWTSGPSINVSVHPICKEFLAAARSTSSRHFSSFPSFSYLGVKIEGNSSKDRRSSWVRSAYREHFIPYELLLCLLLHTLLRIHSWIIYLIFICQIFYWTYISSLLPLYEWFKFVICSWNECMPKNHDRRDWVGQVIYATQICIRSCKKTCQRVVQYICGSYATQIYGKSSYNIHECMPFSLFNAPNLVCPFLHSLFKSRRRKE